MEFGLSRIMAAMYSPNPISGTSQLSHFAAVEMTKPGIGVKNGDFLPIFEILSCTTTASSEVAIPWVRRTPLRQHRYAGARVKQLCSP